MKGLKIYVSGIFIMVLSIIGVFIAGSGPLYAQPAYTMSYQGKLTTPTGIAVANGTYELEFKLYTQATGGVAIWTETRSGVDEITIEDGLFSVMLGSVTSLASVNFNQPLYLGVKVESDTEMTPRKALGTVPSAIEAKQLGGVASTSFIRSDVADTASGLLTFTGGVIATASSSITQATFATATTTNLIINSERFTDLTGVGLTNSSGILSVATTSLGLLGYADINTSAELAAILGDETGSGTIVFGTSPTLTTPNLGTPSTLTLSNATGLPISGINGLGTSVGAWLATPSSANLRSASTDETGNGGGIVFASEPTFIDTGGLGGGTITLGASGMTIASDGDGAITYFGLGNGFDENLTLNLDDTSDTGVFTSGSGLNTLSFSGIGLSAVAGTFSSSLTLTGTAANIALGSNYLSGDGGDEGVFVDSTGSVGIGTTTPLARLDTYVSNTATTTPVGALRQASTGDAGLGYYLGTGASFVTGIDNSDSDSWKLSYGSAANATLGTNDYLTVTTAGRIGVGDASPDALFDIDSPATHTSGNIFSIGVPNSTTLTGTLIGTDTDFTNITGAIVVGSRITTPSITSTAGSPSGQYGLIVQAAGNITQNNVAGSNVFMGMRVTNPGITATAGIAYAYGIQLITGSITTAGVQHGLSIEALGVGAGTLYGINLSSITPGAGLETALNIGSGWDTILDSSSLDITGAGAITGATGVTTSGSVTLSGTAANIALGSNYLSGDGGDEGVFVDSAGSVGIGLAIPTAPLEVRAANSGLPTALRVAGGGSNAGDGVGIDFGYLWGGTFGGWNLGSIKTVSESPSTNYAGSLIFETNSGAGPSSSVAERMRIDSFGDVGIGDVSPDSRLDVETNEANYVGRFFNDGNDANRYGLHVQAGADDGSGTTYYLDAYDGDGGQVGYIANTSGTFALTDVSDRRTKVNITNTEISSAGDVITALRVVDFNRKQDPDGPRITGFIAQEVNEIFPFAVTENPKTGYLGVMKDAFIPLLIKGAQEQIEITNEQESALATLGDTLVETIRSISDLETVVKSGLSENYRTEDSSLEAGEIVALDTKESATIKRASVGDKVFGVVATNPGLVLGQADEDVAPVALSGRVPVKINLEGGDINVGDAITLSSIAGVGTKATTTSRVIGTALESTDDEGVIEIFIEPDEYFTDEATSQLTTLFAPIEENPDDTLWNRLSILASSFIDGVLTVAGVRTDELCVGNVCVDEAAFLEMVEMTGSGSQNSVSNLEEGGQSEDVDGSEDQDITEPSSSEPEITTEPSSTP